MDVYKDFIQHLRKKELDEVYVNITGDVTQKLKEYVTLLKKVKLDAACYNAFYGSVKKIIASFIIFFSCAIDDVVVQADNFTNVIDKNTLLSLVDRTIYIHQNNQAEFCEEFLPINSDTEQQSYDEIVKEHDAYIENLNKLKVRISKLMKQEYVEQWAKDNLGIAVLKMSEMLHFAHGFLGMMLTEIVDSIHTSIEEIYLRMTNNLKRMNEECEAGISELLNKLYDVNKDKLAVTRSERKCSLELAEVTRSIQKLSSKIENFESKKHVSRIEMEVTYWKNRIKEFNEVADNIKKLKTARDEIIQEEKKYTSFECEELTRQKEHIKELMSQEAKALISFFAIRGTDRIFYTDNVGPYYVDEYNHQVYVFDYGLGIYHIDCDGDFKTFPDEAYLFDKFGRFINKDREKIYQCAPCTSQYKLANYNLFGKITKDCGHSERDNRCRMVLKDPNKREILPDFEPIDITNSVGHETIQYLWESFGSLLPVALHDVAMARPRNPIHFLAHKLIYHKYRRTKAELAQKKEEADRYRTEAFKKRNEQDIAISKKWRSKQMKRRKPEESDDAETRAVYDAQIAENMFINSLNYFNF